MANPRTSRCRAGRRLIFAALLLASGYFLFYGSPSMLTGGLLLPYATHAPGDRTIALTFDDGPDRTYTPLVLSVLARYQACATFFVLGRHVEDHPELVRDIVAGGHAVGSHGYSHTILRWVWPGEIAAELHETTAAIHRAAGVRTDLFRHPGGMQGFFLPWMTKAVGWRVVVWSADPQDYTEPGALEIARRVLDQAHPGAIVLLHDGSPDGTESRAHTVEALPIILEELRDRGYRFLCLDQRAL